MIAENTSVRSLSGFRNIFAFSAFMSDFVCSGRLSAAILGHLVHQGYD